MMAEAHEFRPAARAAIRRLCAVLILIAVPLASWASLVRPVSSRLIDGEQRLAEALENVARLKGVVDFANAQPSALSSASVASHTGDFLSGTEDTLIMADLQTRLRMLIVARKAEFSGARTLPPKSDNGLNYLGVKVQFKGDMADVQQIVHAIETAPPVLFIERAQFRLDDRRLPQSGASQAAIPQLQAEIDVYGAKWPGAPVSSHAGRPP
jgi:hypothetical protein